MEQERIAYNHVAPDGVHAMRQLEQYVKQSGLEPGLLELVRIRVSQINGCAYCIDMHTKDARAAGETEQRLYAVSAWRDTPFFDERERAALALCEAVTRVAETHVPDAIWDEAAAHFEPGELSHLLFAIVSINAYNRLAIATRMEVGGYQPRA
jgi:AhpD family alkylhydroperoxidase